MSPHDEGRSEDPGIELTNVERRAMKQVEDAFERNKTYWQPDHDRQHRLFNMILNAENPDKPDVEGRSNIKTGISWMVHQVIFSVLKNSLLTLVKNIRLEATKARKIIFWLDQMQDYLDRLVGDEEFPIYKNLRAGLFDLISHGTAVLRPYYRDDLRMAFDGENDIEVLNYSGPDLPYIASWDTYPTAGATSFDEAHEVIFYEWYYPHELRALERAGKMKNVDEALRSLSPDPSDFIGDGSDDSGGPREQHSEVATDSSGRIGVLVYWGLFSLYEDEDYVGEDGKDRSKHEVETIIIRPVDKAIPLFMGRNPYFSQKKEIVAAKYFDIPGMIWGEAIFGIIEKMFVHQEDWFNIIQDGANAEVYRDRVMSSAVDATQRAQKGVGRDYVVDKEVYKDLNGNVVKYLERGPSILPDAYGQRDYIDNIIQQVAGIFEFLKAASDDVEKTATEIRAMAASLGIRFEQTAMDIGGSLLVQSVAWMMSLLASDGANDEFIARNTGTPLNPFKQFSPMMPNPAYRIKIDGSMRAIQNVALQNELRDLIEQAKTIPPGVDENGEVVQLNIMRMFLDEIKLSKLKDTDDYKQPWAPPTIAPDGTEIQAPVGAEGGQNVPSA